MISIIPDKETVCAFTDKNINSPASQIRVNAFNEANELISFRQRIAEIIIEKNIYEKVEDKLETDHKTIFESLYEINPSAEKGYDITKAIKFIAEEQKVKVEGNKVIIIAENSSNYSCFDSNPNIKVVTPKEFIEKCARFKEIKENYDTLYGALYTALFF